MLFGKRNSLQQHDRFNYFLYDLQYMGYVIIDYPITRFSIPPTFKDLRTVGIVTLNQF